MTPGRKNDMLLKSAFEEAFPDLLHFYFKDADAIFDRERDFEFLDKELDELFPELGRQGGNRLKSFFACVNASIRNDLFLSKTAGHFH